MGRRGRRRKRKGCTCDKERPSSIPCGSCIKRTFKQQRKEKDRQYRAKQKRGKQLMVLENSVSETPRRPTFVVVGTTIFSIIQKEADGLLSAIKERLDCGVITDIVVVAPGWQWSRHAKRHLRSILQRKNASWLWPHVVFQWPHEMTDEFIRRICLAYEVSHFFDISLEPIRVIATTPGYMQKLFQYIPNFDGNDAVVNFIAKSTPAYIPAHEMAEEAELIIK